MSCHNFSQPLKLMILIPASLFNLSFNFINTKNLWSEITVLELSKKIALSEFLFHNYAFQSRIHKAQKLLLLGLRICKLNLFTPSDVNKLIDQWQIN